jgi:ABC-type polysaccharide/polyol phosphate transport system ATPase subunit
MAIAIRTEHLSKEYRLGTINHGMLYKDLQSWAARRLGRQDPHEKIGVQRYEDQEDRFWALKDMSFVIEQGDRVGVIGRNGAGKSTLLKIISRITAPTEGTVKIKGRVSSLLEVGTGFHPELTGRDNIYLSGAIRGMKTREIDAKLDEIIDFSEIEKFIDTPVKRYSSGMFVRLGFAVAAFLDSEILLADEVLAVGDQAFQKKCLGKMDEVSRNQGRTIFFVSHNLAAVVSLCTHGMLLSKGSLRGMGDVHEIAARYLEGIAGNEISFPESCLLERARIEQRGGVLIISASYRRNDALDIPCLAASFYDFMGTPIFIANSRDYRRERAEGAGAEDPAGVGTISFRITGPALYDGDYYVSLHFGDSRSDREMHTHCLKLTVQGMTPKIANPHPENFGHVFPSVVDYRYS